jgi:hypothetical protein
MTISSNGTTRLICILLALIASTLHGQGDVNADKVDPGSFYGFWQFEEPAGDTCVVIIKRGGRLSCFWAGTATRAIEKGTWIRNGDSLTASWDAGHTDVYRMLGDNAIERSTFHQGQSLLGDAALTIRGVRIDSRIPGSLTVQGDGPPPVREIIEDDNTRPRIPVNSPLVGFWKIDQSTGILGIGGGEPFFYLQLQRNGDALVALRDWEGDQGVRGLWTMEGERAIITWPNNRRDVLFKDSKGDYALGFYRPKDELTRQPRAATSAEKVNASEASQYFDAGEFSRLTVVDIRGTWIPIEPQGQREYISIEGWGNAYRFPARTSSGETDPGKWRLDNDLVQITWIDGSKDIIRLSFPDFIQDSYSADEAFSGTPFRSIKVNKTMPDKDNPFLP